jgi:DNA-binding HxlR family transcriptional regulator
MAGKSASKHPCPVARSVDVIGDCWSMRVLLDAFVGLTRFDEFQISLQIAPTMLTRRLNDLVAAQLLERRRYCDKPPRYEYVLTDRGRDFWPVLVTLLEWGNKHLAPEGESVTLVNRSTGKRVETVLKEAATGKRITPDDHRLGAGPRAPKVLQQRFAFSAARPSNPDLRPEFLFEWRDAREGTRSPR